MGRGVSEKESLRLGGLARVLLRAAAEGRLHRVGHVYRWRPRQAVLRAHTSPGISEIGTQLHAFGLIEHQEGDTACVLTERGRTMLAAAYEGEIDRVR